MADYFMLGKDGLIAKRDAGTVFVYDRGRRQWEADTQGRISGRFAGTCIPVGTDTAAALTGRETYVDMHGAAGMPAADSGTQIDMHFKTGMDMAAVPIEK